MEFLANLHILRTEICPDRSEHECAQVCSKFKMNSSEFEAICINSCENFPIGSSVFNLSCMYNIFFAHYGADNLFGFYLKSPINSEPKMLSNRLSKASSTVIEPKGPPVA